MNEDNIMKLDFATIEHEAIPYTIICTKVIQNISDAFAGFIWIYLQSLPADWVVHKNQLMKKFKIGEDKLNKHMAYLKHSNLIQNIRLRDANGQLGTVIIRVLNGTAFINIDESTTTGKTPPMVPTTGGKNHGVVNHGRGNPGTTNTIGLQIQKKDKDLLCEKEKMFTLKPVEYQETFYPPNNQESNQSLRFDEFWFLYPVKKNKLRTKCLWVNSNLDEKADYIIEKLQQQINHDTQWQQIQFIPNPSNYISQERWTDEITKSTNKGGTQRRETLNHDDRSWAEGLKNRLF